MAQYHVNYKGTPGVCKIGETRTGKSRGCPFAKPEDHYSTPEEARAGYEKSMEEKVIFSHKKGLPLPPSKVLEALKNDEEVRDIDLDPSLSPELSERLGYRAKSRTKTRFGNIRPDGMITISGTHQPSQENKQPQEYSVSDVSATRTSSEVKAEFKNTLRKMINERSVAGVKYTEDILKSTKVVFDNWDSVSAEDRFRVERSVLNDLPETLNNYNSIDPETSEIPGRVSGKTPNELVKSNLDQILLHVNEVKAKIDESKSLKLETQNRFLQSV